jgi:hypothetical protein
MSQKKKALILLTGDGNYRLKALQLEVDFASLISISGI